MDNAEEVLDRLKDKYEIIIVSCGYSPNLVAKEKWVKEHMPYAKFIGVNFKNYRDKAHIDMADSIFIDDSLKNLATSNAQYKICFGEHYNWNYNWDGKRCFNWYEVEKYINEIENISNKN
jgi:5'(3')-deoxyribonucleotidase